MGIHEQSVLVLVLKPLLKLTADLVLCHIQRGIEVALKLVKGVRGAIVCSGGGGGVLRVVRSGVTVVAAVTAAAVVCLLQSESLKATLIVASLLNECVEILAAVVGQASGVLEVELMVEAVRDFVVVLISLQS